VGSCGAGGVLKPRPVRTDYWRHARRRKLNGFAVEIPKRGDARSDRSSALYPD